MGFLRCFCVEKTVIRRVNAHFSLPKMAEIRGMEKALTTIFNWMYIVSIIISLYFLLTISKRKDLPINLRYLYLYPVVAILIFGCFLLWWFGVIERNTYDLINSISLFYHFGFLGVFILLEIHNEKLIKLAKYLFAIFIIALTLGVFFRTDSWYIDVIAAHMGLFIISTLYFINIFVDIPNTQLSKIPSFWIIIGIFLHMVISIPLLTLIPIIKSYFPESYVIIVIISLSAAIIMYLSFIKGVICIKTHHK